MAFENLPLSKPASRRQVKDHIFCVGWRAFVNWPVDVVRPVPAMDRGGSPLDNDLVDGQEVEILSWQPRSRRGLLYEIKRIDDGSEWWLSGAHLRTTGEAQARPSAAVKSESDR